MSPTRICLEPNCSNSTHFRGRCQTHAKQRNRETRSQNAPLYNSKRWKLTRRKKLSETPLCANYDDCASIATDVHHIVDIAAGGDPWNLENLQALCKSCHSRITRRSQTG